MTRGVEFTVVTYLQLILCLAAIPFIATLCVFKLAGFVDWLMGWERGPEA